MRHCKNAHVNDGMFPPSCCRKKVRRRGIRQEGRRGMEGSKLGDRVRLLCKGVTRHVSMCRHTRYNIQGRLALVGKEVREGQGIRHGEGKKGKVGRWGRW